MLSNARAAPGVLPWLGILRRDCDNGVLIRAPLTNSWPACPNLGTPMASTLRVASGAVSCLARGGDRRSTLVKRASLPAGLAVRIAQDRVYGVDLAAGHLDHVHVEVSGGLVVEDGEASGDAA